MICFEEVQYFEPNVLSGKHYHFEANHSTLIPICIGQENAREIDNLLTHFNKLQ
jgi:hypothetical protein